MDLTITASAAEMAPTDPASMEVSGEARASAHLARTFNRCGDGLFRFILLRVGMDQHAAEDLIQQVCCEAARKPKCLPLDDDRCEAWLFGIARNRVRKHWRWRRRKGIALASQSDALATELLSAMQRGPLPAELLSRTESSTRLMLAITELPAADQQLLLAFYFDGRSLSEIAQSNQTTAKGVESRLYRIRAKLRHLLGGIQER